MLCRNAIFMTGTGKTVRPDEQKTYRYLTRLRFTVPSVLLIGCSLVYFLPIKNGWNYFPAQKFPKKLMKKSGPVYKYIQTSSFLLFAKLILILQWVSSFWIYVSAPASCLFKKAMTFSQFGSKLFHSICVR